MQQKMCHQLTAAVQHAKDEFTHLCIKTVETQMRHYEYQFQQEKEEMLNMQTQTLLPAAAQLNDVMLDLLEQRANNRRDRIRCVNRFKILCLRSNPNQT